jgi:prolyl 4-hydroxylase
MTLKKGHTKFVNIGSQFEPKACTAVIWNSPNEDGSINFDSIHYGMAVEEGYKAVIANWFRSASSSGKEQSMLIKEHNKFVPNYTKIGFRKTKISSDTTGKMVWATARSCFCLRD